MFCHGVFSFLAKKYDKHFISYKNVCGRLLTVVLRIFSTKKGQIKHHAMTKMSVHVILNLPFLPFSRNVRIRIKDPTRIFIKSCFEFEIVLNTKRYTSAFSLAL